MYKFLVMLLCAFCMSSSFAQTQKVTKIYKVGVLETSNSSALDRIAQALWTNVAKNLQLKFIFVPFKNESAIFQALINKKIDVVVGPVKYEKRAKQVTFLNSYINDSVIIAIKSTTGVTQNMWPYVRIVMGYGIGGIAVILFCVGSLIWLVERRKNPTEFPSPYSRGLGHGMWFALVTLTTVGYGKEVPITFWGRLITAIYMITVLFFISTFIVYITALLSSAHVKAQNLPNLGVLSGKRLGYLESDSYANQLADSYNGRPVQIQSLPEAINLLEQEKIDALFINSLRLRAYLHQHPEQNVYLTHFNFEDGSYAFAVRKGFSLIEIINEALFTLYETGGLQQITQQWLSKPSYIQPIRKSTPNITP